MYLLFFLLTQHVFKSICKTPQFPPIFLYFSVAGRQGASCHVKNELLALCFSSFTPLSFQSANTIGRAACAVPCTQSS